MVVILGIDFQDSPPLPSPLLMGTFAETYELTGMILLQAYQKVDDSAFLPEQVFFHLSRLWCERWNERSELAGSCNLNRAFNFFDKSNVLMNGDGPPWSSMIGRRDCL